MACRNKPNSYSNSNQREEDLMNILIQFTAELEPDFVSRQIMSKDKVEFSHVLVKFEEDNIFHAVGEGVCVEKASEYFKTHKVMFSFPVQLKVSRDYFLGFVEGSKGKEYSQSQIAAIASGGIAENGNEKMICSELVGIILTKMAHYSLPGSQDSWRPIHCFRALKGI
jgi:hypothetical protein